MGIREKARKLAMAAAVPGMVMGACAVAGAAPAMAGTAHHQDPLGFETFHGFGSGEYDGHFGVVPLYAHGVINDHGFIDLLGPNPGDIIHLSHGDLDVSHTDYGHEHLYPASCTIVLSAHSRLHHHRRHRRLLQRVRHRSLVRQAHRGHGPGPLRKLRHQQGAPLVGARVLRRQRPPGPVGAA